MRYLHTMLRVRDLDAALDFYCNKLGLKELRRHEVPQGRYTLVFLSAPGGEEAQVELTHNWDPEAYGEGRNFGTSGSLATFASRPREPIGHAGWRQMDRYRAVERQAARAQALRRLQRLRGATTARSAAGSSAA